MTDRNGVLSAAATCGSTSGPDAEDWESMLDSGVLDQSLDQITIKSRPPSVTTIEEQHSLGRGGRPPIVLASRSGPARPLMSDPFFEGVGPVRILTHDGNAARTQYRPPEPQLKILKRPSVADSGGLGGKPSESQAGVRIKVIVETSLLRPDLGVFVLLSGNPESINVLCRFLNKSIF